LHQQYKYTDEKGHKKRTKKTLNNKLMQSLHASGLRKKTNTKLRYFEELKRETPMHPPII